MQLVPIEDELVEQLWPGGRKITMGVNGYLAELGVKPAEVVKDTIEGGDRDGQPRLLMRVAVDPEELEEIADTGHFWLEIWGEGMPPIAFFTEHLEDDKIRAEIRQARHLRSWHETIDDKGPEDDRPGRHEASGPRDGN